MDVAEKVTTTEFKETLKLLRSIRFTAKISIQ